MKTAVCPGSFDPVTLGHIDIIRRAAAIFDHVIVVVMNNTSKTAMFTQEERVDFLKRATAGMTNVEIDSYGGLLADYTQMKNASVIVKGLRALSDFEYEFQMALTNRKLNPQAETAFLTTSTDYMYLSSSLVKQVAMLGGDIRDFVPACIVDDILRKVRQINSNKI
ncbi:MAG TPA: pantetheine-phosphate adenylyltransferase [Clostridiales bacterium]|nr:pantetheine-phosphate adenylyltransferase [Clostridiales bacterium]